MNSWPVAVFVIGAIVVVALRVIGEPLNWRDVVAPPLVLCAIGVWGVVRFPDLTGADIAWVVGSCVVGFAFGAARGATATIYTKNGELWQRYTKWSLALVVAGVVVSGAYTLLAVKLGMHDGARPYQLAIGISFAGEAAVLIPRGLAMDTPFARDRERPWDRLLRR
ncbi:DUF1453 domain-containing protein [Actinokineospora diospyrosa]|uniref:DUF1453 domain-containing protein n=1 Tax=Actinokineospora diospyrosa TaxID=103728 RepID=A0ABT1INB1_9PSEU|nr:DUF1453 domain-containing protein [Actinokineospora diospyrosa]MCP2274166.1 Protein of unknown function (DUF1453) [Actinokineospora diospyrosa]